MKLIEKRNDAAMATPKYRKLISKRVKNTYQGIENNTIPEGGSTIWLAFNSETGKVRWEKTRKDLRNFVRKNPSYSSPKKATLEVTP